MDDSGHQAQNATGTLKALQRCPIPIQPVKNLGMNRVAGYHTIPVLYFLSLHRKIRGILLIHAAESVADHISGIRVFTVEEQSAAYNFKAFICCNRLPDRFHAAEGMLNGFQRSLTSVTANFNIRLWDRRNYDAVIAGSGRLRDFLNECNKVIIGASGKSLNTIYFLGIRNQLIHQNKTRTAGVEQGL